MCGGLYRTLNSWESEAESDLAPPELGFSFFLFCFFFFRLAPKSPPGLLHVRAQTGRASLWTDWFPVQPPTLGVRAARLTLATIATANS